MTEIILYSTSCPKCKILETKLQNADVHYTKNTSIDEMTKLGFTTVPMLKIGEKVLNFGEAVKWVNNRKED